MGFTGCGGHPGSLEVRWIGYRLIATVSTNSDVQCGITSEKGKKQRCRRKALAEHRQHVSGTLPSHQWSSLVRDKKLLELLRDSEAENSCTSFSMLAGGQLPATCSCSPVLSFKQSRRRSPAVCLELVLACLHLSRVESRACVL